jgi:SAM-dependent methyltransferase
MALPRVNVGSGLSPRAAGQINADLYPGPQVDVAFDATRGWPFPDDSVGVVTGNHVLEHLADPWAFFAEAWRVLAPSKNCNLQLRLPYGPSGAGIGDLTHVRQWVPGSFACFQPGYHEAVFNPQHTGWRFPFSVMSIYLRIDPALRWLLKPGIRAWGLPLTRFLWGGFTEMLVGLRALKGEVDVLRWRMEHEANVVPVAYCMYQHEYEGRSIRWGDVPRWKFFGDGARAMQRQSDALLA